jgi:hypothetical protein
MIRNPAARLLAGHQPSLLTIRPISSALKARMVVVRALP